MLRKISALALALLVATGCDAGPVEAEPTEGSCQALVDELWDVDDCQIPLGRVEGFDTAEPRDLAQCVASSMGLEQPPEPPTVEGMAYQVAYQALCAEYGNGPQDYCEISATLGCEG